MQMKIDNVSGDTLMENSSDLRRVRIWALNKLGLFKVPEFQLLVHLQLLVLIKMFQLCLKCLWCPAPNLMSIVNASMN